MALTWEEMAELTRARQFPRITGRDTAAVAEALHRVGPIQAQTARSPFLALAARLPGVTLETVTAAYDEMLIVRGSNLRGTVHTSTAADHPLLEVATRTGQCALWKRTLQLHSRSVEEVWSSIEQFASDDWRTPIELLDHLVRWVAEHDPDPEPRPYDRIGRYFAFGHGGLIRRPLSGGWQGQTAPGYRTATALLGSRDDVLAHPDGAIDALVLRHLGCHGPGSRRDLAWWSGLGLRVVDTSLQRLDPQLTATVGPDGRTYHDLRRAPTPIDLSGVRLLPEFDALLCGYHPAARERFVTPEHHARLWSRSNGLLLAPLLVDGRLTGFWKLPGTGGKRRCEVTWFVGTRRPHTAELVEPVAALEAAYGITVTGLTLNRD